MPELLGVKPWMDGTDVETTDDDQGHSTEVLAPVFIYFLKAANSFLLFSSPLSLLYFNLD